MILLLGAEVVKAAPVALSDCPRTAFLTFNTPTGIAEIDLFSFQTDLFEQDLLGEDIFGGHAINAIGFDQRSKYIYGLANSGPEGRVTVRIGSDGSGSYAFDTWPNDLSRNAWVADVFNAPSPALGLYVFFDTQGLHYVELPDQGSDPLPDGFISTSIEGSTDGIGYDLAFHPDSSDPAQAVAYSIDTNLTVATLSRIEIDFTAVPPTVMTTKLGKLKLENGDTIHRDGGALGAIYFSSEGDLYAIGTTTGMVYRWPIPFSQFDALASLGSGQYVGKVPSVDGNVDAARCPAAAVLATAVDYGDAPASYGTAIEDGGPMHSFTFEEGAFWLGGVAPDLETEALYSGELNGVDVADETDGLYADELMGPGHVVIPELFAGESNILTIPINTFDGLAVEGLKLNIWIDLDDDGDFSSCENLIFNLPVDAPGVEEVEIQIPSIVSLGVTWMRMRLSSVDLPLNEGWLYGAGAGEVEDHLVTIVFRNATTTTSTVKRCEGDCGGVPDLFKILKLGYEEEKRADAALALQSFEFEPEPDAFISVLARIREELQCLQAQIAETMEAEVSKVIALPADILTSGLASMKGLFSGVTVAADGE